MCHHHPSSKKSFHLLRSNKWSNPSTKNNWYRKNTKKFKVKLKRMSLKAKIALLNPKLIDRKPQILTDLLSRDMAHHLRAWLKYKDQAVLKTAWSKKAKKFMRKKRLTNRQPSALSSQLWTKSLCRWSARLTRVAHQSWCLARSNKSRLWASALQSLWSPSIWTLVLRLRGCSQGPWLHQHLPSKNSRIAISSCLQT